MVTDWCMIINGVMWTQVVLAVIFIGARMYTRYFLVRNIGWDDIIMIVNLLFFIVYVICISIGVTYGIGKKAADVPPAHYSKAIMWEAIGQGVCILGIAASKASVAIFLLRIVVVKWHIALLWGCIVSTTLLCIITTTLLFLQCKPTAFLWDHTIEKGECWLDFVKVGLTMGSWSAAMDFFLALLPWHVILGLNMKRKEKLTVAVGLSLGVFAGICSIIRTYELNSLASLDEYVFDTVPMLLWSSTEVLVTIICACVPVLRPLYVKIIHGSQHSSSNGNGKSYGYGNDNPLELGEKSKKSKSKSHMDSVLHSQSNIYISGGKGTGGKQLSPNTSEESILQNPAHVGVDSWGEGIKRTDEVTVSSARYTPANSVRGAEH